MLGRGVFRTTLLPTTTTIAVITSGLLKTMLGVLRLTRAVRQAVRIAVDSWQNARISLFNDPFHFQPQLISIAAYTDEIKELKEHSIAETFGSLWFAAPKSKISPSRKRQKHMKFFPDRVNWEKCDRCGDPKRPHRICTDHKEVCAMRKEEYEEYRVKKASEDTPQQ